MNQDPQGAASPQSPNRKYLLLGLLVTLIFAGWSVFWYISYSKTQDLVDKLMARQIDGAPLITCTDQQLGGYPFRLHLTCSSYQINDARSGWFIQGGPLRAIWQVYAPNLAVIEAENRLTATHQQTGETFDMTSELMRGSIRLNSSAFVTRGSFEATKPTFLSNNPIVAEMLGNLTADRIEMHLRPNPDRADDLDLSIAATELVTGRAPVLSGQLSLTAVNGLAIALQNQHDPAGAWLRQSGKMEDLHGWVEIGQKILRMKGDLSIDQTGLANGRIKLRILNPHTEDTDASRSAAAGRDGLNGPLTALQLMGRPIREEKLTGSEVDISLSNGQIRAGILPLGKLPAIR